MLRFQTDYDESNKMLVESNVEYLLIIRITYIFRSFLQITLHEKCSNIVDENFL